MIREKTKHFFEFGPFRLDPAEKVLLADGRPAPLTPKAFETLLALVENSGHILEKDELLKRVWPDTFVEEGTLVQNIATLRKALGEGPDHRPYIETVPRRGYRFSGTVRRVDAGAPAKATHSRAARPIAVGAAIGGVLLLAVWFARDRIWTPGVPERAKIMLAVMPFVNLNGDSAQDYFSNGLTEEMIAQLGALEPARLGVIARTSAMQYKDTKKDARQIGRELGVDYLMEGSVRRDGEQVRITAQLVQVKDQTHLWAQNYDRNLRDILGLQRDVAGAIAREIKLKLTPGASARLANGSPRDPQAYELYLQGRYFWNKRTESGFVKAIEYFNEAIARDPNYAQAHAGLADAYALLGSLASAGISRHEAMSSAKRSALRALDLDDSLAEAHTSLAFVLTQYEWDWQGAEREFRRALELNPNYATAHQWYGLWFMAHGKFEQALEEERLAQEADPLSIIIETDTCQFLEYAGRNDEAIRHAQRALELDPGFPLAHLYLAEAYDGKRNYREAIAELIGLDHKEGGDWATAILGRTYALAGQRDKAEAALQTLLESANHGEGPAILLAQVYTALGEKEPAFAWLEKAYRNHEAALILLGMAPAFQPLGGDPRYKGMMQRMSLAAK
jgi:TolB-like protein/DNA-binding winged helix-turn-helix (wHTH) protein/Tfp pilus assembly protein PilF